MYLHLGGDCTLLLVDVVAILRADVARDGPTREMVQSLRARGRLTLLQGGPPRSLILTRDRAYFSPVSTIALLRRAQGSSRGQEEDIIGRTSGA